MGTYVIIVDSTKYRNTGSLVLIPTYVKQLKMVIHLELNLLMNSSFGGGHLPQMWSFFLFNLKDNLT
jgi:hypothetical protein